MSFTVLSLCCHALTCCHRPGLGCFNITSLCHGTCVEFVKNFGKPLLVLGGGGYTISSVARCWTYETACLLGADIQLGKMPPNDYYEHFVSAHWLSFPCLRW